MRRAQSVADKYGLSATADSDAVADFVDDLNDPDEINISEPEAHTLFLFGASLPCAAFTGMVFGAAQLGEIGALWGAAFGATSFLACATWLGAET